MNSNILHNFFSASNDVRFFLTPDPTELTQVIFFLFILIYPVWSGINLRRKANKDAWHSAWINHSKECEKDDLDIEHGSIKDLSEVVATSAERRAEIVPGILLVVGLLGTFIGIGMALNKAAAILGSSSDQGAEAAASAMQHMLPMLKGLGMKFKTSTWGIIGYLSYKWWYSKHNTEEERLRWCISQSNKQLLQRRAEAERREEETQQTILGALNKVGAGICRTMQQEVSQNRKVLLQEVQNGVRIVETLQTVTGAITEFIIASQASAEKMSLASDKIATSATALDGAVGNFSKSVETTLAGMTQGFTKTMTESAGQLRGAISESSEILRGATSGIQKAVDGMSSGTMQMLSDMDTRFLGTMKAAINQLQESMLASGKQLQEATSAIHVAVETMSGDVAATQEKLHGTLKTVAATLHQSEDRQLKMQLALGTSSDALKVESKVVMGAVRDVIKQLDDRLSTVSSGNLQMMVVVETLNNAIAKNNLLLERSCTVQGSYGVVGSAEAPESSGGYA